MWLTGRKKYGSDEEIVNAYFESGDKTLVGELFEKHVKTVYGVCLFYFRDQEISKDAVMMIFEKLLVELRKNRVKNFGGWLSYVVRNHCISELRKSGKRHFVSESYLDFELKETDADTEEKLAKVTEERMLDNLKTCLPNLKEEQRKCIEQFYLKGDSYEEIAKQNGMSVNEVKSRIQNGKRNLKLMIEEMGRQKS
jgi:RNA polymerase sigma factor (sigma-70 family)